ncbi:MAG: transglutaminase-like domain-containing protein [Caldilinea sp.]|uniref:transglutaminase-like domain-containing protein n=1 Tax=Caldilinea sp. TaxID=2293560 RepID=UPI0030A93A69
MNERAFGWDADAAETGSAWSVRSLRWLIERGRPDLGWTALALCLALSMLPAALLWENRWLRSGPLIARLYLAGPLAILLIWLVLGWRRPWTSAHRRLRILGQGLGLALLSAAATTQLLVGWAPGPGLLWQAATTGAWGLLVAHAVDAWQRVLVRYALWWQGVQNNAAGRDDLVVFGFALAIVWLFSLASGWLAYRRRNGLLAATPILWLVGLVMLYSAVDRWLFMAGVALALLLHLALDQQALLQRWRRLNLDHNPIVLTERAFVSVGLIALVVTAAAVAPNLYSLELASRYYALLAPVNARLEALAKRAFPELTGVNPWSGSDAVGGLPNEFLLRGGPTLNERPVMRVRTSEPPRFYDAPPLAHNLRGMTFSTYDGRGWQNPASLLRTERAAEQPWASLSDEGRRPLLQNVSMNLVGRTLFAAGEPLAPSVSYQAEERFPGDLVALRSAERSYTIVSLVPALSADELDALPGWEVEALPDDYAIYLELPERVTSRVRALATQLTADEATLFAKATAIERYLRTFPYDLTVPSPPEHVQDVADYFLFDLQRGYCDYYATAFVVLARAAGIPARFVTGFTNGSWNPEQQAWTVTEADAHSWPEVYFPQVGWIPFEPTAGRPELARIGLPRSGAVGPAPPPTVQPLPPPSPSFDDRWLWLILPAMALIAIGIWLLRRWRLRHEDPWETLLRWGSRLGRSFKPGETVLEYGAALAMHIQTYRQDEPELRRLVSREVLRLSEEISALRYAPAHRREQLHARAAERWGRLRGYLRRIR